MLRSLLSVIVLLVVAAPGRAGSWDWQLVERADVIAVARVKPGTFEYVPHAEKKPGDGRSWEHHVTIVVSRTIKGEFTPGEHRVILHFGITPCVGGHWSEAGDSMNLGGRPEGVVELVDGFSATPSIRRGSVPDDAREDHVWLLRRVRAGGPDGDGELMLGIRYAEQLQPLRHLDYLKLYLQDDPEPGVRRHVQRHPEDAARALPYLQHRNVQRVIAEPDPARRVERLLPYFISSEVFYGCGVEAGEAIEAVGDVAVPYLVPLLSDWQASESLRWTLIRMLGRIGSKRAVPALVAFIETNNPVHGNARKVDDEIPRDSDLWRRLYDMSVAISALGRIGEASSVEAIRNVQETWHAVLPADHFLVESWRYALKQLEHDCPR